MFIIARRLCSAPKRLLVGIAVLGSVQLATPARLAVANEVKAVKAVIELFSSQGCSSSPPANQLIEDFSKDQSLIILSFNVPYWDYIGWKDTLADQAFAKRQKSYAFARGDRSMYTPQAVINGRLHALGSDRKQIENALQEGQSNGLPLAINLTRTDGKITVGVPAVNQTEISASGAEIWAFWIRKHVSVHIERGDNAGKTVLYHNSVTRIEKVGELAGSSSKIVALPSPDARQDVDRLVVLIQRRAAKGPGEILGAALTELP